MTGNLTVEQAVQSLLATGKPADEPAPQNTPEEQKDEEGGDDLPSEEPEGEPEGETEIPDDEPEEQSEPLYTVTIDGKEEQVKLDELRNGYQRGTDYQRKTTALAEQRRQVEAEKAQYQATLQKASAFLSALEQNLVGKAPDWEKVAREEGKDAFLLKREQWRLQQERLGNVKKAQEQVQQEQLKEQQQAHQRYLEGERAKLLEALPAWRDPKKAEAERNEIVAYGKSMGFSEEELKGASDSRAIVVLRKAMLFDKGKALRDRRQADGPKPLTPGKAPAKGEAKTRERDRALERLKREGSVKAGVAALLARRK